MWYIIRIHDLIKTSILAKLILRFNVVLVNISAGLLFFRGKEWLIASIGENMEVIVTSLH